MVAFAIIRSGGKQYLVKKDDEVVVDNLASEKKAVVFDVLAFFDGEKAEIGTPILKVKAEGEIVENLKGDKVRIAKFKSKVRYRKSKGFRSRLTKVKITKLI